jgi:hypothetical protein
MSLNSLDPRMRISWPLLVEPGEDVVFENPGYQRAQTPYKLILLSFRLTACAYEPVIHTITVNVVSSDCSFNVVE